MDDLELARIRRIRRVIGVNTGRLMPSDPVKVAERLCLKLSPRPGARFALQQSRWERTVVYDSTLPPPEQNALIARGCAMYALQLACSADLGRVCFVLNIAGTPARLRAPLQETITVDDLAQALCGCVGERVRYPARRAVIACTAP